MSGHFWFYEEWLCEMSGYFPSIRKIAVSVAQGHELCLPEDSVNLVSVDFQEIISLGNVVWTGPEDLGCDFNWIRSTFMDLLWGGTSIFDIEKFEEMQDDWFSTGVILDKTKPHNINVR